MKLLDNFKEIVKEMASILLMLICGAGVGVLTAYLADLIATSIGGILGPILGAIIIFLGVALIGAILKTFAEREGS